MSVKQISITLDNTPGQFLSVSEFLGGEGINIRAISVADTSDVSTVRFVTDDPQKTINVLQSKGYTVREKDVLAVEIPDHPGGLNAVVGPLRNAGVNIHYLYPYLGRVSEQAIVILGVDKIEQAQEVLQKNFLQTLGKEIYTL